MWDEHPMTANLSDEELLESPLAEKWKKEAREYWEKWLPGYTARLKKKEEFEKALNQAVVNALRTWSRAYLDLCKRPEVKDEPDFLERVGRMKAADYMAQELAKETWLFLPPEREALRRDRETT
ncbi:MAG: hypothetical protein ACUVTQ_07185 [Desulfotomaculales bacterium]